MKPHPRKRIPPTRFGRLKQTAKDMFMVAMKVAIMGLVVLAILMFLSYPFWWVSDEDVVQTASSYGMTDVRPDGYAFFVCAKSEAVGISFTATNSNGKTVNGVVCCGLMSCGVRF